MHIEYCGSHLGFSLQGPKRDMAGVCAELANMQVLLITCSKTVGELDSQGINAYSDARPRPSLTAPSPELKWCHECHLNFPSPGYIMAIVSPINPIM